MMRSCEPRDMTWRSLELLAILILVASAAGMLAMRLGVFHALPIWIVAVLCTYWYSRRSSSDANAPELLSVSPPVWHLVLVLGLAVLFRYEPFVYLLGGQDEGVYTNMAAHLIRTGGLEPSDPVVSNITNPDILKAYLQSNYNAKNYLPGIYNVPGGLEFQFYHLFPVWLGLFGDVFGIERMGFGLLFLSLTSILFFQRLASFVSGSAIAGLVAGVLIAINPLHAFFSKFPVTEVPTLAFSTICFTFLAAYWRIHSGAPVRYLVVSIAALAALFMTRISGFMYLPVMIGLLFLSLLIPVESSRRRGLIAWSMAALLIYAASVAYGLTWSRVYATDIYQLSFGPLLGEHWKPVLVVATIATLLAWLLFWWISRTAENQARLARIAQSSIWLLPAIVAIATGIAAWHAYKLGFTDAYADHPWYGHNRFKLAEKGLESVRSVSVVASAFYLSPFLLLGYYISMLKRPANPMLGVLTLFVSAFYAHVAAIQWVLPYQPYYARYLVSEFVPYVVLLVVATWATTGAGARKTALAALLVIGGAWGFAFSLSQVGKNEHEGVATALNRVRSFLDAKDLVLIDGSMTRPLSHELKTPLVYTHGLTVVSVSPEDVTPNGYAHSLARPYHDVFYLTRNTAAPEGFAEVDSIDFVEKNYCHSAAPPTELCVRSDSRLMLYKRTKMPPPKAGDSALKFSAADGEIGTLVGVRKDDQLWSGGRAGVVMFGPYQPLARGFYTLVLKGDSTTPFTFDVVAQRGSKTFYREQLERAQNGRAGLLARSDFVLDSSVADLEVRVSTPAGSDIRITGYEILYREPK